MMRATLPSVAKRPQCARLRRAGQPTAHQAVGDASLGADAVARTRTPGGHPEGYLEAFANLYRDAFRAISAEVAGRRRNGRPAYRRVPTASA